MGNIKLLSLFSICCFFSSYTSAETISQKIWSSAINNKDGLAQYYVAQAYNPLIENDDWDCRSHQFYLESKDKKLAGCHNKSAEKYIEFLTKSAKNLYPLAQTDLGIAYIEGKLVAKDIKKGIYWLEKAASPIPDKAKFSVGEGTLWLNKEGRESGVGEAQYVLGTLYDDGVDVKADYNKAIMYYKKASKSYDWGFYGKAQYKLYLLYKNKINDPKKMLYWLEQTATHIKYNKALDAPMELVDYFLNGGQIDGSKSEQPNYPWATKWLIEFVDYDLISNKTRQKIALQLAWHYLVGLGIEKDPKEAAKYYCLGMGTNLDIQPSDKQTLQNQFLLNVIQPIYNNLTDSYKFDYREEMEEYHSEELKNRNTKIDNENQLYANNANNIMAKIFGDNLKDEEIFYIEFQKGIKKQMGWGLDDGYFSPLLTLAQKRGLAYGFYREAENMKGKSVDELINLYQSALQLEPTNPKILYQFGTLYDFVIQDVDTAMSYYKQAADLNYSIANYRLGVLYFLGKGVKQNYHEAWRYLDLAAQQQYVPAQDFLITIDKSHPEFDWLITQYIDHPQDYHSPTVIVDGKDWLQIQHENNPTPKITYHFTKHNFKGKGFEIYDGCNAAIALATQGDRTVQQDLVKRLNSNHFTCTANQELMYSWIDNSHNDDQKKQFLKAKYYQFTKQDEQYKKELNQLADHQNQYAIIELLKHTWTYYDSRDDKYLSDIKMLLKSGNVNAAELLIDYYYFYLDSSYKRSHHSIYHYTKAILLRNDLADYISDSSKQRSTEPKHIYANNILSSADIYKIWFELANMHEQGVDIPKNNVLAYVWYSLLVEHNQTEALNKVQELKAQLTTEQLAKANDKFNQYRSLYRYLPLVMGLNQE
jgi:TPR repeat protein